MFEIKCFLDVIVEWLLHKLALVQQSKACTAAPQSSSSCSVVALTVVQTHNLHTAKENTPRCYFSLKLILIRQSLIVEFYTSVI